MDLIEKGIRCLLMATSRDVVHFLGCTGLIRSKASEWLSKYYPKSEAAKRMIRMTVQVSKNDGQLGARC